MTTTDTALAFMINNAERRALQEREEAIRLVRYAIENAERLVECLSDPARRVSDSDAQNTINRMVEAARHINSSNAIAATVVELATAIALDVLPEDVTSRTSRAR